MVAVVPGSKLGDEAAAFVPITISILPGAPYNGLTFAPVDSDPDMPETLVESTEKATIFKIKVATIALSPGPVLDHDKTSDTRKCHNPHSTEDNVERHPGKHKGKHAGEPGDPLSPSP